MTNNWEELTNKERLLAEKEEDLRSSRQKLKGVAEDYDRHFFQASRLFAELQENFHQNDSAYFFQEMAHELQQDTRRINEQLEEQEWQFKKANQQLQDEVSELALEKKQLILDEQEETK